MHPASFSAHLNRNLAPSTEFQQVLKDAENIVAIQIPTSHPSRRVSAFSKNETGIFTPNQMALVGMKLDDMLPSQIHESNDVKVPQVQLQVQPATEMQQKPKSKPRSRGSSKPKTPLPEKKPSLNRT